MNQNGAYDWPSDDASDSHDSDSSEGGSQPRTLVSRSQLRPAGSAFSFVPFTNWEPERSYAGEPTIHYNVEWKLFVKNRGQAGESELDIVISPRKFWKHILRPKLTDVCANKPWEADKTKLILSVTDRKTSNITKHFSRTDVDWSFVAKQL